MSSRTEENYLKALYHLSEKHGEINISELSKALEVSTPTANSMIKKLDQKKLVAYEKYKPIVLTDEGKYQAALIIRKHRLTEMFLVKNMGIGWEEVHDIAEQIEHINSKVFFDKIDELLGHPKIDPHGSPIPDKNGNIHNKALIKMSECKKGNRVRLSALAHSSAEFLNYLNSREIQLGIEFEILSIEPFDQSITLKYQGHTKEMFSHMICERLLVEII